VTASRASVRGEWSRGATVFGIAVVMTAIMSWPVLRAPHTVIFGNEIVGRHHDPFTVMQQFESGRVPRPYLQPLTDEVGMALATAIGPIPAYNAVVLFSFPLAAIAAYVLARYLSVGPLGAAAAAFVFAFSPAHLAHAAYHPHVAQIEWLPVYLLALFFSIDRPNPASVILLVASVAALVFSNFYGGFIGAVVTPVALGAYWAWSPRGGRTASGLLVPVGALMLVCVAAAYVVRAQEPSLWQSPEQFAFSAGDAARYGARWVSYVLPPVEHVWLGSAVRAVWDRANVGPGLLEQQVSLGWGVMGLAAIALYASARGRIERRISRSVSVALLLAVWAIAVSFAPPDGLPGLSTSTPSALLYSVAPMFRSYARFGTCAGLALAIAAGAGAEYLIGLARTTTGSTRAIARGSLAALLVLIAFEFCPVPWRFRDVLPTQGHRWLAARSSAVRALDCAPPTLSDASVPWLMGRSLAFMTAPFDDCADPDLVPKLAALGYTHVLERADSPRVTAELSQRDGLTLLHSFADSRVFGVSASAPPVLVVARSGFFDLEHDERDNWRWMTQSGFWVLRNMVGIETTTTLEIELSAFAVRRLVDVRYEGKPLTTLTVEPARERFTIGPFPVPPGDHQLAFVAREPATRPAPTFVTGDARPLTVMFARWRWVAG